MSSPYNWKTKITLSLKVFIFFIIVILPILTFFVFFVGVKFQEAKKVKLVSKQIDLIKPIQVLPTPIITFPETATYINRKYGYVVDYPGEWEYVEANKISTKYSGWAGAIFQDNEIQKVTFRDRHLDQWQAQFEVSVSSNPAQLNLNQWVENYKKTHGVGNPTDFTTTVKTVRDIQLYSTWAKALEVFAFDHGQNVIAFLHNGSIFQFSYNGDNPNDNEFTNHLKQYEKMRNSFRFIKEY